MKRVLFYTDDPGVGGVAQYNQSMMLGFVRAGYQVGCAQTHRNGPLLEERRVAGIDHYFFSYDSQQDFMAGMNILDAGIVFEKAKPDLIWFSDGWQMGNLGAKAIARLMGIPYVVTTHSMHAFESLNPGVHAYRPHLRAAYQHAEQVVVVSECSRQILLSNFPDLPPQYVRVIYNGRPDRFFCSDPEARRRKRQDLGLTDRAIACVSVGRIDPEKGYHYIVLALSQIADLVREMDLQFYWLGPHADVEYRAVLERLIAQIAMTDRIHMPGPVDDVDSWLEAADIVLHPSEHEAFPLAIIEAMGKQRPVVASRIMGIPEMLGERGLYVESPRRNPELAASQLRHHLVQLASSQQMREEIAREQYERASGNFRESRMIEGALRVLDEVRRRRSAPALTA